MGAVEGLRKVKMAIFVDCIEADDFKAEDVERVVIHALTRLSRQLYPCITIPSISIDEVTE